MEGFNFVIDLILERMMMMVLHKITAKLELK
jgi:hypothetical protein